MSTDYYKTLGLNKDANVDEIKRAYKKMALKWHPDKNPDNQAEATRRFKDISEAFSVLGDSSKKYQYDNPQRFERGEFGSQDFSGHQQPFTFRNANDIFQAFFGSDPFESFFGRGFGRRGESSNRSMAAGGGLFGSGGFFGTDPFGDSFFENAARQGGSSFHTSEFRSSGGGGSFVSSSTSSSTTIDKDGRRVTTTTTRRTLPNGKVEEHTETSHGTGDASSIMRGGFLGGSLFGNTSLLGDEDGRSRRLGYDNSVQRRPFKKEESENYDDLFVRPSTRKPSTNRRSRRYDEDDY